MGAFQNYPYADVHQLNLDWIIKEVKEIKDREDEIDQAVTDSKGYAETAQESAENASQSAIEVSQSLVGINNDIELLKDRVATNTEDIAVDSARIDSIISGTTPDANAELIDIRVGYNGTTYATAGDAVRDQVSDLHDGLDELNDELVVLGDQVNLGGYSYGYIRPNGSIGSVNTVAVTGSVTFTFNGKIKFTVASGFIGKIATYQADGTHIENTGDITGSILFDVQDSTQRKYRCQIKTISSLSDIPVDGLSWNSVSYTDVTLSKEGKAADAKAVGNAIGENLFDYLNPNLISAYPNSSTHILTANTNASTLWIECDPDTNYTVSKVLSHRFMVSYTESVPVRGGVIGEVVADEHLNSLVIHTGANAHYLLVHFYFATEDTLSIPEILETVNIKKGSNADGIITIPLSLLPDYFKNSLAYKPMAEPTKGYICLVSDDGDAELANYAIPMLLGKNVPCTFAVMSSSAVFDNGTKQATVIDAVNNHGCEISQHGGVQWTSYNELRLNQFFDVEKTFFEGLGLEAKSAVIPAHYVNNMIKAVAGGRYGVVRGGYYGYNEQGVMGGIEDFYNYYTSGLNSNLYGLSSYNIGGVTLAQNETAIDYAYDNNKVLIGYWHDNSLNAEKKAVLEATIDYAKNKGLQFVTLSQLAHLIDLQRTAVI